MREVGRQRNPATATSVTLLLLCAALVVVASGGEKVDEPRIEDVCVTALDAWDAAGMADIFRAMVNTTHSQPTDTTKGDAGEDAVLASKLVQQAAKLEQLLVQCSHNATGGGGPFSTSSDEMEADGGAAGLPGAGDGGSDPSQVPPRQVGDADSQDQPQRLGSINSNAQSLCIRNVFNYAINVWVYGLDKNDEASNWEPPSTPDQVYGGPGVTIPAGAWDCRRLEIVYNVAFHTVTFRITQPADELAAATPGPGGHLFDLPIKFANWQMHGWGVDSQSFPNAYSDKEMKAYSYDGSKGSGGDIEYVNPRYDDSQDGPGMVLHWKKFKG